MTIRILLVVLTVFYGMVASSSAHAQQSSAAYRFRETISSIPVLKKGTPDVLGWHIVDELHSGTTIPSIANGYCSLAHGNYYSNDPQLNGNGMFVIVGSCADGTPLDPSPPKGDGNSQISLCEIDVTREGHFNPMNKLYYGDGSLVAHDVGGSECYGHSVINQWRLSWNDRINFGVADFNINISGPTFWGYNQAGVTSGSTKRPY